MMLRAALSFILALSLLVQTQPASAATTKAKASTKITLADLDEPTKSISAWSIGMNYGVSTDLAEREQPRLYYQGLGVNVGYTINPRWSLSTGLSASFTTIDGQVDKRQEETVLESSGVNPALGLNYSPGTGAPWFLTASANAFLDSASRREGYKGLFSLSGGATWTFFKERFAMTHSLTGSELVNTFDYSTSGAPNPGTSIGYAWNNSLKLGEHFSLGAGFGLKQTRYLDGFWDYSYMTSVSATVIRNAWSMSFVTSNGGYTEDGRVSLWYIDQYRRLISLAMAYQF